MKRIRTVLFLVICGTLAGTPAFAWEIPGCRSAYDAMGSQGALRHVAVLIKRDCPVMYRKGWVIDPSGKKNMAEVEGCRGAWNALAAKKLLSPAKFLVTHNCPVIYRKGWR